MNYTELSQRDPLWMNKRLGNATSNAYTIGAFGCTITTLTNMLNRRFGYTLRVDEVNERLKKVGAFAPNEVGQKVLLIWALVPKAFSELKFEKRVRNYNNAEVSWWVYVKKLPVMVEVQFGAQRHWVLFIGGRQMVDPWTGTVRSTSTYPTTGYTLFS